VLARGLHVVVPEPALAATVRNTFAGTSTFGESGTGSFVTSSHGVGLRIRCLPALEPARERVTGAFQA
jgi:hypothetical protein